MPDESESQPLPSNVTITVNPAPPDPGQTAPSESQERFEALWQDLRDDVNARFQSLHDLLSPQLSLIQSQTETLALILSSVTEQRTQLTDFLSEYSEDLEEDETELEREAEIAAQEVIDQVPETPPASVIAEDQPIIEAPIRDNRSRRGKIGLL